MDKELLLCQCGDPSHQLIIFYDDENHAVYVSVNLVPERNFFRRLWNGIRYVFSNKRSIYGDFDEVILKPEDADKLQKAVDLLNSMNKDKQLAIPIFLNAKALPS